MEGVKHPGVGGSKSPSNMMFYAAIAGKEPTIGPAPEPPAPPTGSLRWLGVHCRQYGYMMGTSVRNAVARCRKLDVTSLTPGQVSGWIVREYRQVKGFAERQLARTRRAQRVH